MSTGGGGLKSGPQSPYDGGRKGHRRRQALNDHTLGDISEGILFGWGKDKIPVSNNLFTHTPEEILSGKRERRHPKKSFATESW